MLQHFFFVIPDFPVIPAQAGTCTAQDKSQIDLA
jgi:hypothetical protein